MADTTSPMEVKTENPENKENGLKPIAKPVEKVKVEQVSKVVEVIKIDPCSEKALALLKNPRKLPFITQGVTPEEIAQEISARAEKKRQYFPDGVDVLMAMKSPAELRNFNQEIPGPTPAKMPKMRDKNKVTLDTNELLNILQDGAETHYVEKPKPRVWHKGARTKDLNIDPELEKSLAIQQLSEFSRAKGRPRISETNNNKEIPKKKETKKNRELSMLLQDEGAVNMLHSIKVGKTEGKVEIESKERLCSSQTRRKKLKKKTEQVKEALLSASESPDGVTLRKQRQERSRQASVESEEDFPFQPPAEASKIIRRHSSSSSYSSRGSSPRRLSIETDKPQEKDEKPTIKIGERTEKLIEMKCKELNLQPAHSEIIRQLVQDKKNGWKERLQTQFANKFKEAVSSPKPPPKPVWKVVEEDWESDENLEELTTPVPPTSPSKPGIHEIIKKGLVSAFKQKQAKKTALENENKIETKNDKDNDKTEKQTESPKKIFLVNSVPAVKPVDIKLDKPKEKIEKEPKLIDIKQPFQGTDVRLEKINNITKVNIAPKDSQMSQSFNAKVLGELCQALDYLNADPSTKVIIFNLSSIKGLYCNGIDLPSLLSDDFEQRKSLATLTASALRDFICKLCMIGRPVLTAVSGKAIGLGVVMLAYCDYVIADETATFFTPYSRLGYVPEAGATLVLPHVIGHRRATSLLLGCAQLDSSEAEQCGLVTKVVPRIVLESRLMEVANNITQQSVQTMVSTKALLMHTIRTRLPGVLNMEVRLLEQHWASDDCQNRIKELQENPIF